MQNNDKLHIFYYTTNFLLYQLFHSAIIKKKRTGDVIMYEPEKRGAKRLPLKLKLKISSLFKQHNDIITNVNAEIEIENISKTGIGFKCKEKLPLNYYFDADIDLGKGRTFWALIKIIRIEEHDYGYFYGCQFVGLADIISSRIEMYAADMETS